MMNRKLNGREMELLGILQEECAEIIQIISKIRRFGIDSTFQNGVSNQTLMNYEIGDFLGVLQMLTDMPDTVIMPTTLAEQIPTKIAKVNHYLQS